MAVAMRASEMPGATVAREADFMAPMAWKVFMMPQTRAVETLPTESDNMILTVRKDGAIFLDSYEVGLDELQDKINLLVKQQNKQLFLQADKDVAYGLVVDVMGRIREAGIDKLGVVALREDTPAVPEKKGKK